MASFNVQFNLNCPSRRRFRARAGGGISVETEKGEERLWVTGIEATSREHAFGRALEVVNRVLDEITLRYDLPLAVLESPTAIECLDDNGKKVTTILSSDLCIADDEVTEIRVVKPDGSVEVQRPADQPTEVMPSLYDCTRFFRCARGAEVLHNWFEAMREYFRAIEWVVTATRGRWDIRAMADVLDECFAGGARQSLRQTAVACPGFQPATDDLPLAVAEYLYVQHRCELAHAKALVEIGYKVPFDTDDENQVRGALPLARFVARELINRHHAQQSQ
jgi:hypothetical protein